jgi:hypothetical protein
VANRQQPLEEREPGSGLVPDPRQRVQHDCAHGVEEQVVMGWFVHARSLQRTVVDVPRICGGNVKMIERLTA